jgi:hypothetical protein
MFQTKVVEEIETHLMFNNAFPENRVVCETMWENAVEPAHALCMQDNEGYSRTLRLCTAGMSI